MCLKKKKNKTHGNKKKKIKTKMQKENMAPVENHQYVGPYRLEKTLGKGQTGKQM